MIGHRREFTASRALRLLAGLLAGLLLGLSAGCDHAPQRPPPGNGSGTGQPPQVANPAPIPVAKPTRTAVIAIDLDTLAVEVVEPPGARACTLCSAALEQKYGPGCKDAQAARIAICDGLVNANVQAVRQIPFLRSKRNPSCVTIACSNLGGTETCTQLCFCEPTDPAAACPAQMWVE